MKQKIIFKWILAIALVLVLGCSDEKSWNDPYPNLESDANTFYSAFSERPKHLDPAKSYSSSEWAIISQIYEPPLQYSYLKRPYVLENLVSRSAPRVFRQDKNTVWEIKIKPGIMFQPHPAFVKNKSGKLINLDVSKDKIDELETISSFTELGSRELIAEDFVYQIKRLADPKLNSPIYGFLNKYIYGLDVLRDRLLEARKKNKKKLLDLRDYIFSGAYVVDKYTYRVIIKGSYPQFKYWLAMPFFAPIPWEADLFYQQPGMSDNNISLDWYPVGTGPYMLTENNPERRMVLVKNPNFHGETYPVVGDKEDISKNLLVDAKKELPFIDKIIFTLEKEDIPYWNKFLQGFFDISGISSDSFNSAIDTVPNGSLDLTPELREKQITLNTSTAPTTMYWGFNMLDKVVGGYSDKSRKLRQAISIVFDVEEFISIFANGRGIAAQSPIPPGIEGFNNNFNSIVYKNNNNELQRREIEHAKKLLAAAGYPDGRDVETGEPLVINFEAISSGDPNEKAVFSWLSKQLDKLNIQLNVRVTDYNRFQDKMKNGSAQMYFWGWNADYPDPENFLFMFYGPNGKVKHGGENSSNYENKEFDKLFTQLEKSNSKAAKTLLITRMLNILQNDAPWIWGYHPQVFSLQHAWVKNNKPSGIARNTMKYIRIEPELRQESRINWNKPVYWPFFLFVGFTILVLMPAFVGYSRKEKMKARRIKK